MRINTVGIIPAMGFERFGASDWHSLTLSASFPKAEERRKNRMVSTTNMGHWRKLNGEGREHCNCGGVDAGHHRWESNSPLLQRSNRAGSWRGDIFAKFWMETIQR